MSLTTRKQQAKAMSPAARKRAAQAAQQAQQAAQQAAQQLGPIAKSARENAAQRLRDARVWAAPRIEHAAHSVQDNVAPKVSAALEATAHRLEPAPAELKELSRRARRRARAASLEVSARREKALAKANKAGRRWPRVVGGVAFFAATIGAITAMAMRRNRDRMEADLDDAALAATEETTGETPSSAADTDAEAGFDGQVRTP